MPGRDDNAAGRARARLFVLLAFIGTGVILAGLAFLVFEPPIRYILLAVAVVEALSGIWMHGRLRRAQEGMR